MWEFVIIVFLNIYYSTITFISTYNFYWNFILCLTGNFCYHIYFNINFLWFQYFFITSLSLFHLFTINLFLLLFLVLPYKYGFVSFNVIYNYQTFKVNFPSLKVWRKFFVRVDYGDFFYVKFIFLCLFNLLFIFIFHTFTIVFYNLCDIIIVRFILNLVFTIVFITIKYYWFSS